MSAHISCRTAQAVWLSFCCLLSGQSLATECVGPSCVPVKKRPLYVLNVLEAQPSKMVENDPITAKFHLEVSTIGVAGAEPAPVNIEVCPKPRRPESTCQRYNGARSGKRFDG